MLSALVFSLALSLTSCSEQPTPEVQAAVSTQPTDGVDPECRALVDKFNKEEEVRGTALKAELDTYIEARDQLQSLVDRTETDLMVLPHVTKGITFGALGEADPKDCRQEAQGVTLPYVPKPERVETDFTGHISELVVSWLMRVTDTDTRGNSWLPNLADLPGPLNDYLTSNDVWQQLRAKVVMPSFTDNAGQYMLVVIEMAKLQDDKLVQSVFVPAIHQAILEFMSISDPFELAEQGRRIMLSQQYFGSDAYRDYWQACKDDMKDCSTPLPPFPPELASTMDPTRPTEYRGYYSARDRLMRRALDAEKAGTMTAEELLWSWRVQAVMLAEASQMPSNQLQGWVDMVRAEGRDLPSQHPQRNYRFNLLNAVERKLTE